MYITQNALKCGDIDVLNSSREKVNPAVIEENKRIFENEIKIREKRNKAVITIFSIFGVLLLLLSILIISDSLTDETAFLSIAFLHSLHKYQLVFVPFYKLILCKSFNQIPALGAIKLMHGLMLEQMS